jgi:hypothetical protein
MSKLLSFFLRPIIALVRLLLAGIKAVFRALPTVFRWVGYGAWAWSGFWLIQTYWPHSFLPALLIFCALVKKRRARLTAHGTARWADRKDLTAYIHARHGILIGRLVK